MKNLRTYIKEAEEKKVAIGHFNISDSEQLWAIFNAARELNFPVIIGVSEGEGDFIGVRQAALLVASLREEFDYPIFINADHSYSFERVKKAIDVGFDAVIYDGNEVSYEENISITKQCVEYARASRKDVLVEAELGNIGKSSKLLDAIPEGVSVDSDALTKPEQIKDFVMRTGVDLIAPAVGTLHGMLKSGKEPHLDIPRITELRNAAGIPMVLHGGSGTPDGDFIKAIRAGISIIHINTEIRKAYRDGIEAYFKMHQDEVAPYRFMKGGQDAVQKVVKMRLKMFNDL